jgi:uncharacterized protein (TIGR02996 family)
MTTEDDFLEAMRLNRFRPSFALQWADWLEQRGEDDDFARAEFVRVQCTIARLKSSDPRRVPLRNREAALLKENRKRWTEPLNEFSPAYVRFARGLIADVGIEANTFVSFGRRLLHRAPATWSVWLFNPEAFYGPLSRSEPLSHLRALKLVHATHRVYEGEEFFASPSLKRLRNFDGSGGLATDSIAELLSQPEWTGRLRSLTLQRGRLTADGLRMLLQRGTTSRLRKLALSDNRLGSESSHVFWTADERPELKVLDLRGNELTNIAVVALAASPLVSHVRKLNLANNRVGLAGVEAILKSHWLRKLRWLNLDENHIDDSAAALLAEYADRMRLQRLSLRGNGLSEAGIRMLADAPSLRKTHIALSGNAISGSAAAELSRRHGDRVDCSRPVW